jgi:Ca2+-binding EF-hand superfamily protein
VCGWYAASKMVRAMFDHMQTLHADSFAAIMAALEGTKYEVSGRAVVDVDRAVAALLDEYQGLRQTLRGEATSLFSAGDVNDDGVLSLQEFREVVKLVLPSITTDERKIWGAFRECCSKTEGDAESDDEVNAPAPLIVPKGGTQNFGKSAKGAAGVSSDTFVAVMERMVSSRHSTLPP